MDIDSYTEEKLMDEELCLVVKMAKPMGIQSSATKHKIAALHTHFYNINKLKDAFLAHDRYQYIVFKPVEVDNLREILPYVKQYLEYAYNSEEEESKSFYTASRNSYQMTKFDTVLLAPCNTQKINSRQTS